jgi:glycolate oxidase iron-sulfur subunit
MEATRADFFDRRPTTFRERLIWNVVMRRIFPSPTRLRALARGLRLYQRVGLQALVRRTRLLSRISADLAKLDALTPDATRPIFEPRDVLRYQPVGEPRARVAMLTGCVMPLIYGDTHHATARVLSRNGARVVATEDQVCCGALHAHSGDVETARKLARKNIDAFLADDPSADPDAIVVNSAGCGSHMKEIAHLLRDDRKYAAKAERFAALVRDVHEYLIDLGVEPPEGIIRRSVTYQDSCHLVHAQQVTTAPRQILGLIPGLELREMDHPDRCCGSAGIYSIAQSQLSRDLLASKMEEVNATGADQICTANPGCMVQLDAGMRLHGDDDGPSGRALHTIDLLDESYRLAEGDTYAGEHSVGIGVDGA